LAHCQQELALSKVHVNNRKFVKSREQYFWFFLG